MTMAAGTVVVAADGTLTTHTGYAAAVYDQLKIAAILAYTSFVPPQTFPSGAAAVPILASLASQANAHATAAVAQITTTGNPQIIVPANAFGVGVPASPVTIGGAPGNSSIL